MSATIAPVHSPVFLTRERNSRPILSRPLSGTLPPLLFLLNSPDDSPGLAPGGREPQHDPDRGEDPAGLEPAIRRHPCEETYERRDDQQGWDREEEARRAETLELGLLLRRRVHPAHQ